MEKLSPAVLESFGLPNRGIRKEKGQYICSTAEGLVKIHSTPEHPEAINLQHSIKEYLAKAFPHIDPYRLTTSGEPYIIVGRETYVATVYPQGYKEIDFEDEGEVLSSVRALAKLHGVSKAIPQNLTISPPLPEIYARYLNDLAQGSKQARRAPRMSDFDVSFIKYAPTAVNLIQDAIERLNKTNYSELYTNAVQQGSLCHNALKEENILITQGPTYIVNYANAAIDLQLNDLAALIRRYAQRSTKSIPARRLIKEYDSITPLPRQTEEILYAQLILPWAFLKLSAQYYSKKRNWTPNGLITRMETVLAERESYEAYIRGCLE